MVPQVAETNRAAPAPPLGLESHMAVPCSAKPKAASSTSDEWNFVAHIDHNNEVVDALASRGIAKYTVAADSALFVDKSTLTLRGLPAILKIQSVEHRWKWLVRHLQKARFVQRLFGYVGILLNEEKAEPTLPPHRRRAISKLWTSLRPYTSKYKGIK